MTYCTGNRNIMPLATGICEEYFLHSIAGKFRRAEIYPWKKDVVLISLIKCKKQA
jgi:hypothetical protein